MWNFYKFHILFIILMFFSHIHAYEETTFPTRNDMNGHEHRLQMQTNTIKIKIMWMGAEWYRVESALTLAVYKKKDVKWISIWIEMATCTSRTVQTQTSFESNRTDQKSPEEVTKISALSKFISPVYFAHIRNGKQWKMFAAGVTKPQSTCEEEEQMRSNVSRLMLLLQQLP